MDLSWIVSGALALIVLVIVIAWWWSAGRPRRAARRRQRIADRGEKRAEKLLRRAGYEIVERQAERSWTMRVDDEDVEVHARADLLVRRGRARYVAEVKTGERAPDPTYPPTRRQLLEYAMVYDVDGVLLVDVPEGRVHEVEFPDL